MDWRKPPSIVEKPPEDSIPTTSSDSDSEEQAPPPQYFKDVKNLIPNLTKIDMMKAWDKTTGIGKGSDSSVRVQAAIGLLLDQQLQLQLQEPVKGGSSLNNTSIHPPPSHSISTLGKSKGEKALFRPDSPDPEEVKVEESSDLEFENSQEVALRRSKSKAKGKGPGKERERERVPVKKEENVIVILDSDDDEEEDVEIIPPRIGSSKLNRLARSPPPPILQPRPQPRPQLPTQPLSESEAMNLILSIVPDVLPSYVKTLMKSEDYVDTNSIVEVLLSGNDYPKVEVKRSVVDIKGKGKKRKLDEEEEDLKDYLAIKGRESAGHDYKIACFDQLSCDYDLLPLTLIRSVLNMHSNFYAPTYVALAKVVKRGDFEPMTKARAEKKSKKGGVELVSDELEREKKWLRKTLVKEHEEKKRVKLLKKEEKYATQHGLLVECMCCFGDFVFDRLISCTDAHLFCRECIINLVKSQIGSQQYKLNCMTADCEGEILESDIVKVVNSKYVTALGKIRMEKEVDLANLPGLSKCPFCPYACLIENDNERILHCQREGCMKSTCRECKKLDHLPKTCAEAKKEDNLGIVHSVEEEMSLAAIRFCPKCKSGYVKSDGCNYITCSSCHTASCFVCRKLITSHDHFDTPVSAGSSDLGCPMFDDTLSRTHHEIETARKFATNKALENNPHVGKDQFDPLALAKPHPGAQHSMNRPLPHQLLDPEFLMAQLEAQRRAVLIYGLRGGGGGGGGGAIAGPVPRELTTAERRDQMFRAAERRSRE